MLRILLPVFFLLGATALAAQSAPPAVPPPSDTGGIRFVRPRLDIEGETIICPGSITALKVKGQWASYEWSTGQRTPNLTVYKPGTYDVTVTTQGGCMLTGSVTVRYSDSPCL